MQSLSKYLYLSRPYRQPPERAGAAVAVLTAALAAGAACGSQGTVLALPALAWTCLTPWLRTGRGPSATQREPNTIFPFPPWSQQQHCRSQPARCCCCCQPLPGELGTDAVAKQGSVWAACVPWQDVPFSGAPGTSPHAHTTPCPRGLLRESVFLQGCEEHHPSASAKALLTGAFAAVAAHGTHHHLLAAVSPGS